MSCCNFSGVDNRNYNLDPETERITEAIYSDWTEAAGGPMIPGRPDFGGRSADDEFNPNPPITPTSGRVAMTDECVPQCTDGERCVNGECQIITRMDVGTQDSPQPRMSSDGTPITPQTHLIAGGGGCTSCGVCHPNRCHECEGGGFKCDKGGQVRFIAKSRRFDGGQNFDGAAVKQNWVPLVVLGLSLVIGIGISEWASKKYIK